MPAKKPEASSDLPKLAAPATRALNAAGLTSLAKLSRATEAEVMALHGMGSNAMRALKAAMKARGIGFAKR
jgi:predicted Fe-Mo cluster-binding NifX family protein